MTQPSPWPLTCIFFSQVKKEGPIPRLQVSMEGVIPETLVRVQTGHGGLTLLKVPSLVSLLWVLTTSWSCFPPGRDSAQGSDVSLTVPKGETVGRLDWERSWGRGDTLGGGGL